MLFSDKYPEANERKEYEHGNYIWNKNADNCYVCGRMTHFIEQGSKTYICSEECDEKFYDEIFIQAIKK